MTINPTFTFLKQNIHIGNQCDNINQYLQNKLHGPMHYKIGDTGVFNGHVYILLLQHDNLIHLFQNSADHVMSSRASGQCFHAIKRIETMKRKCVYLHINSLFSP